MRSSTFATALSRLCFLRRASLHTLFSGIRIPILPPTSSAIQPSTSFPSKRGSSFNRSSFSTHRSPSFIRFSMAARQPPPLELAPLPNLEKVRIALCQLSVVSDKEENISRARAAIRKAADDGARLILLPEMWNCPYSNPSFPVYAEVIEDIVSVDSPSTAMLSEVAKEKKVTVVGGSIPERRRGKLYNTCCVYGADGQLKGKFSKVHLFDIDIPGKITFMESLMLSPGDSPLVVDTEVGRIGIGICYDLRFPELAMLYAARGVHLICYPGAFNMTTGPLHWELLQRGRAVDNLLYIATCSPARDESASYVAWGHSTLVDPFGVVVATTEEKEAIVIADMDFSEIIQRRSNLPIFSQRRGDIYSLVDVQRSLAQA